MSTSSPSSSSSSSQEEGGGIGEGAGGGGRRTTTDKTIYVYDSETSTLIPYRPDYSVSVPITITAETISRAIERKEHAQAPKQDKQLGVIVPLIRQPPNQSDWVQLATIARKYPRVNTIAVVSPTHDERGIGGAFTGAGPDAEYQNAIRFLQANGVVVAGYVNFGFTGEKTPDDLKREVDRWREWYPDVQALFITPEKGTQFEQLEALAAYAKIDRAFSLIILDMAGGSNYTDGGGVINRADDYVSIMPAIDVFVIYNREGYPADGWYNSIRKGWMAKYNRSKFAFIPYKVKEDDALACRNFIDRVVGIEKMAGYIYVHSAHETDRRKFKEWTNISTLLEITLQQLDMMANQEGIPFTKGVTPERTKPLTEEEMKTADARAIKGTSSEEDVSEMHREDIATDKFGIRKIYSSAQGDAVAKEWFIFMDNPRADQAFRNLPEHMEKEIDGSWSFPKDKEVRLEVWSPTPKNKWLNVEITGYFKTLQLPPTQKGYRYVVEQYARGGRHDKKHGKKEGTAYKARLLKDGAVDVVKEISHGVQTGSRGTTQATNNDLVDRWIGMKTLIYNYPKMDPRIEGKENTFVAIEIWIDDNVTDENGNLVIKNDWKPIMKVYDEGGWMVTTGKKKKGGGDDTILTKPGGSDEEGNCVAWRWDGAVINFKYLSVREIDGDRQD